MKKEIKEPIIECIAGEDVRCGDSLYFNPKNSRVYKLTIPQKAIKEKPIEDIEGDKLLAERLKHGCKVIYIKPIEDWEKEFDGFFGETWKQFLALYDKAINGKGFNPKVIHPKNSAIQERIKSFIRQLLSQEKQKVEKEEFHRGWDNCEKFWGFKDTQRIKKVGGNKYEKKEKNI